MLLCSRLRQAEMMVSLVASVRRDRPGFTPAEEFITRYVLRGRETGPLRRDFHL